MKSTTFFSFLSFVLGLLLGAGVVVIGAGTGGSARFSDVPAGSYYDDAIGELAEVGIIRGNPDGSFRPASFVTRADVAVMLKRLRDDILGASEKHVSSRPESARNISGSSFVPDIKDSPASAAASNPPPLVRSANPAGSVRFTIGNFHVYENEGVAKITLIRTGGNRGVVSVTFTLEDATAVAGEDYVADTDVITFADGETSRMFTIRLVNDSISEGDENLAINLDNPAGGVELGVPTTALVTIKDDDKSSETENGAGVFSFSALAYSMGENKGSVDIPVVRSAGSSGSVSVEYLTNNGTAFSGVDYETARGKLDFADGETKKTFTVFIDDDSSIEGKENIIISLINPMGGAVLGDNREVNLDIVDDEVLPFGVGALRLNESEYTVMEKDGELGVVVERIGGADGEISVDFSTVNGTAKAGSDYDEVKRTLTFASGEISKEVVVPIIEDDKNDPNEAFRVTLDNIAGGATFGGADEAIVKIPK